MKITDIKAQVKRAGRYSIFVDGKYSFSLSENELLNLGLKIGQEFDRQGLEKLKKTAIEDKVYMRSLDLILRRKRSEWELRDYLRRKDYEEETAQKVIDRLREKGYVNDEEFAKAWVDNRRLLKNMSKKRLWQELKQKRIDDEIIQAVLEVDMADELAIIKEVITSKRQQTRYRDKEKLTAYLIRQGFRFDDIRAAMTETDDR
jgi:regulatory protein